MSRKPFLAPNERDFLRVISELAYANPFLPERVEYERRALGRDFVEGEPVWSMRVDRPEEPRANAWKIKERTEPMFAELRLRLATGAAAGEQDLALYEDAILAHLYWHYVERIILVTFRDPPGPWSFYRDFLSDWEHYLNIPGHNLPGKGEPRHTFSICCQILRAFHHIFTHIIGGSMAAARLRAAVWQSIFTHDMRRYRRTLYDRMADFATLITGPSGTGKELVARAIALSRYVPFNDRKLRFEDSLDSAFHPINLAALPSTLVESELFGHRRGAFTSALQDRRGWLEVCPPLGTVFLDEIGDLDPAIQVKLLRVIETRTFQPLGDTASRQFHGKLIAATNRDLARAIQEGAFREDFYYRLCSDLIVTPSLADQLRESPELLHDLVLSMARQAAGSEADALAEEAAQWIRKNLGPDYPWPGNYRELAQCVRNVLVRKEDRPAQSRAPQAGQELLRHLSSSGLTADQLLRRYCTVVYSETGSYEETARRLELDRRTVKSKIDVELLERLRS